MRARIVGRSLLSVVVNIAGIAVGSVLFLVALRLVMAAVESVVRSVELFF